MKKILFLFLFMFINVIASNNDSLLAILDDAILQKKIQDSIKQIQLSDTLTKFKEDDISNDSIVTVTDINCIKTIDTLEKELNYCWHNIIALHKEFLKCKKENYNIQNKINLLKFLYINKIINKNSIITADSILIEINNHNIKIQNVLLKCANGNIKSKIKLKIQHIQLENELLTKFLLTHIKEN